MQKYSKGNKRVSFIRLEQNRGPAGARMEAIRQTYGDAIAFVDQDDRWHPQKLQRQIERLRQDLSVQAVHTDVKHIDPEGNVIPHSADRENAYRATIPYDTLERQELTRQLFLMNSIRLVSALILREAFERVGGFDQTLFGGEDWEFWVRFAASGSRIAHVPLPLVERRLHPGNTSQVYYSERTQGLIQAIDKVLLYCPDLSDLVPHRKSLLLRQKIVNALITGRGGQIRSEIRQYIQFRKGKGKVIGYLLWLLSLLGPLQGPVARTGLGLARKVTQQGWAIVPERLRDP